MSEENQEVQIDVRYVKLITGEALIGVVTITAEELIIANPTVFKAYTGQFDKYEPFLDKETFSFAPQHIIDMQMIPEHIRELYLNHLNSEEDDGSPKIIAPTPELILP